MQGAERRPAPPPRRSRWSAWRPPALALTLVLLLVASIAVVPGTAASMGRPAVSALQPGTAGPSASAATSDPVGAMTRDEPATPVARPARTAPSSSAARSPSPAATPPPTRAPALVTDIASLFAFVCPASAGGAAVRFTRNPELADPVAGCRPARAGELTVLVSDPPTDPARLTRAGAQLYDRVQTGPDGYAVASVPLGRPFTLTLVGADGSATRADVSPVYRLSADGDRRQPLAVRIFAIRATAPATPGTTEAGPAPVGSPAVAAPPATPDADGTPASGTPIGEATAAVTILGLVCVSADRAGSYDYVEGLLPPTPGDDTCRRATVGELEFLLLDNLNPSRLYDDVTTGVDGIAIARAPVDRALFVTAIDDDPAATGIPDGSPAITIPSDTDRRVPVGLTVTRYVAPGALGLPPGSVFVSTVACPDRAGPASLGVLGPAPAILLRPPGADPATPQPGTATGCHEAAGDYLIAPDGDGTADPIALRDGADDGALVAPLPATLAPDGTRVFPPYRITEVTTGLSATFDVRAGAWTSIRVVLPDERATPIPDSADPGDASDRPTGDGTPGTPGAGSVGSSPAVVTSPTGAPSLPAAEPTAVPEVIPLEDEGGMNVSPIRLLWAGLAVLAFAILLVGGWVLRRPGHRWHRHTR